ncbi:Lysophospholipid acyltransferase LPEAT2 [Bienertia sinuspersici]
MADHSLVTPFLAHNNTNHSSDSDSSSTQKPHLSLTIEDPNSDYPHQNPFQFLGVDGFCVPSSTTADPFRNHTYKIEGVYEWLKIVICIPIAVIRLALFGLTLGIGYIATKIALHGWKDKHNPMPRWRSNLMWVTRITARCILFSFGYHWIKRRGRPAPRETAPIIVSNHVSYIDPIFYFYELFPTIVASDSHDTMPVVGTIIRAMQVIYVNRFSPSSRKHAVNEIKAIDTEMCFQGPVYRERLHAIVILACFYFRREPPPMGDFFFLSNWERLYLAIQFSRSLSVILMGNISLGRLMFRMFTQFHNFMETAHAMATALNAVQTSYTYGDMLLLMKAVELKQENPSKYMVELGHIDSSCRINTMEALEFLEKFISMNPDSSGYVKNEDFCRALRLKPCGLSEKIFAFVDIEKTGNINFKQFLLASNHIMKQPSFQRACEFSFAKCCAGNHNHIYEKEVNELFNMFDSDGDGKIRKHEFLSCLRRNPLLIALFTPLLQDDEFEHASNGLLDEMV